MPSLNIPTNARALLFAIEQELTNLSAARETGLSQIGTSGAAQEARAYHSHKPAYDTGGMLAYNKFAVEHILAVIGFHLLDWRDALHRLVSASINAGDNPACLLVRMRSTCEADATLEVAGFAWCRESGLLKRGSVDGVWIKRPSSDSGRRPRRSG